MSIRPNHAATLLLSALLLASTFFSLPSLAEDNPVALKPYRLEYQAVYNFLMPFKGKAIRELTQLEDGSWQLAHSVNSALIKVKENSYFQWQDNQPLVSQYDYLQSSIAKKKRIDMAFDWAQNQATNSAYDPARTFAIEPGTQDKLSYQVWMRQHLLEGQQPQSYVIADKKRLKTYNFEVLGEEILETKLGKVNTLKLKRDRGPDAERQTIFWLVPEWDYLLAQIEQTERGKTYRVKIKNGSLDGEPLKVMAESVDPQ